MVSLRYHIVSITAVFLALAIGIAVGTTVIDKATVDTLESRLEDLEDRIANTEAENGRLNEELDATTQVLDDLGEQGGALLLEGRLVGVPVVFIAARGVDGDSLEGARRAVLDAGAAYGGTLWLTDRLALDDDGELGDLTAIVGGTTRDVEQLRATLANRLAGALLDAAALPDEDTGETPSDGTTTTTESTPTSDESGTSPIEEPPVLRDLRASGFIDFEAADGASGDVVVLLPGLRLVMVSGAGVEVPDTALLLPLLTAMAAEGPAPVVAASAAVGTDREEAEAARTVFVGPIRGDDLLRERVSTVDDIESFAGWAGLVLAVRGLALEERGHFGVGEGADRLLPPAG